jgi:hypothetical protein
MQGIASSDARIMAIESAFLGTLGGDAESKISKASKPYVRLNVRAGDARRIPAAGRRS